MSEPLAARTADAVVAVQRLDSVHVLRGLAALAVCLAHIASAPPASSRFSPVLDWLQFQGDTGFQVFFLISGFVIPWSLAERSYSWARFPRYMARRLLRLEPPYFAVLALAVAVGAYRAARLGQSFPYDSTTILLHAGYLVDLVGHHWIVSVFWTLGVEFQFYIVIGLVFPWLEAAARAARATDWGSSRDWLNGFIALLVVQALLPHLWVRLGIPEQRFPIFARFLFGTHASLILHVQYFAVGLLIFAARLGVVKRAVPLLACGILLLNDWLRLAGQLDTGIVLAAASAVILLAPARLPFLQSSFGGRVLAWLGRISYSLYLIHLIVLGKVITIAEGRGIPLTGAAGVAVFAAELAVCLIAAWVLCEAVEQPAMRFSRRFGMAPPTQRPAEPVPVAG